MNEPTSAERLQGRHVVTSDGVGLGAVDGETDTHIRVHVQADDSPEHLWLPRTMIAEVTGRRVHLNRRRADLHDAVFALSPGEQREYATLEPTVKIGRGRWLGG